MRTQAKRNINNHIDSKSTEELLTHYDQIALEDEPTKQADRYLNNLVGEQAWKRCVDCVNGMPTEGVCEYLKTLETDRERGEHALPSWKMRVKACTHVLMRRHPEVSHAMESWDPTHTETPIPGIIQAARTAVANQQNQ